ncbi:hypothetical protein [Sphingomonas arenae]|uniref:hypothetical protein n=1 Tax=Sphingomonas arenae TaxID=2812555 RepID=UPI001F227C82|nr:hypothetical protein [Sphingomonas arenae]
MRLIVTAALYLALAACATRPPAPVEQPRPAPQPGPRVSGDLIGLTVNELGQRFGQPTFQVREGPGLKLQWSGGGCVLDVFLYTPADGRGAERVTYVDARRPTGDPTDQAACIAAIDAAA